MSSAISQFSFSHLASFIKCPHKLTALAGNTFSFYDILLYQLDGLLSTRHCSHSSLHSHSHSTLSECFVLFWASLSFSPSADSVFTPILPADCSEFTALDCCSTFIHTQLEWNPSQQGERVTDDGNGSWNSCSVLGLPRAASRRALHL